MDETIRLNRYKYINATDKDMAQKIGLSSSNKTLMEYDIRNVLNVTDVYEGERQNTDVFRLYGSIDYLSCLNGLITGYTTLEDFFTVELPSAITKNILSDFKFYVVIPTTADTLLISGTTGGTYERNYMVISELDRFEIYKSGWSTNLFNEQRYTWNYNQDFSTENRYDSFNFPLTTLYLYAEYQPQVNGNGYPELMSGKTYNATGGTIITPFSAVTDLISGDTIIGDVINYYKELFLQERINIQEYYISTSCLTGDTGSTPVNIIWKYYPLIPITIDVFEEDIQRVNISGTSHQEIAQMPSYATKIDDKGNYVWRNLQDRGFVDPLTGIGVNYPFVNQHHYVFNNIILALQPDLSDPITAEIFSSIKFGADTFINSKPNSNLNNIGKLCSF